MFLMYLLILGIKIGFICKVFYEYILIFIYLNNLIYFEYIIWVKMDFLKSIRYLDNVFVFEYIVIYFSIWGYLMMRDGFLLC